MKLKNTIFTFFVLISFIANTQEIGSWRLHFEYHSIKDLAYSDTKIIGATNKSLLSFDLDENADLKELKTIDKANGLSDIGISCIAYCKDKKTFVIAYNSTNIDLFTDDLAITNIPDVKNKLISTSKNINDIYIYKSSAYLSTDLGIIILDVENQEIDNTYIIGNGGNPEVVLDCTIFKDTIYALTSTQGVKVAALNNENLLDFSVWKNNTMGIPSDVKHIETFENSIYLVSNNKLYKKTDKDWDLIFSEPNSTIRSLEKSEKLICVIDSSGEKNKFLILDESNTETIIYTTTLRPQLAVQTKNNKFVGDLGWGMVDFKNENILSPSGKPFSNDIFSFSSSNDKIFASAGSLGDLITAGILNPNGFYYFQNEAWHNVNKFGTSGLDDIVNFVDVKENPINEKVYGATTTGLVEYDYEKALVYDSSNSKLEKESNDNTFVVGLNFDSKGNIWMANSHSSTPLKMLSITGEWYEYPLVTTTAANKYSGLYVDSHDQIWIKAFRNGIGVFPKIEDYSANHNAASIALNSSNANLPNNNVRVIVEDKNGAIWVGTEKGIGVFDCPEDIFEFNSNCKQARQIKSTLDEYTEYLFDTDVVSAIAVDGANRKWIGTDAGLWLISESGEEILKSFNIENSPMPSNEVVSIAIQEQTGEVFIGTKGGMISYMGDATEPAENLSNIKAFPNPATPTDATISITGLVENTFIKITDINGNLIDDGYALGGKYVWNGNDYNGNRASTGIYLIFSSDSRRKQKAVAKIVFIN